MSAARPRAKRLARRTLWPTADPRASWLAVHAFVAALITYICGAGGLFFVAPLLQIGLWPGVVAGLVAVPAEYAAIAAAAAAGLGSAILPSPALPLGGAVGPRLFWAGGTALLAGTAAYATALASARLRRARVASLGGRSAYTLAVWVVLACLVATLWVSALSIDSRSWAGSAPLLSRLAVEPKTGAYTSDDELFRKTFYLMRRGGGYYEAFRQAWGEEKLPKLASPVRAHQLPFSRIAYRLPTLFWLWRYAAPGRADGIVYLFLAFAATATVAAYVLASSVVRRPLALVGAVAVAAYYMYPATSMWVTHAEPWASALALAAAAAYARSRTGDGRLEWAAVVLAVLAAFVREHMVFLLVAGLLAAGVAPVGRRRALAVWAAGGGLVVVAYVAHWTLAGRYVSGALAYTNWLRGSIDHLVATVRFSQGFILAPRVAPFFIVALGLAGAARARPFQLAVFLSAAALLPLGAFLVVGNGLLSDYWGAVVVPLVYAMAPLGFAWTPYARIRHPTVPPP